MLQQDSDSGIVRTIVPVKFDVGSSPDTVMLSLEQPPLFPTVTVAPEAIPE